MVHLVLGIDAGSLNDRFMSMAPDGILDSFIVGRIRFLGMNTSGQFFRLVCASTGSVVVHGLLVAEASSPVIFRLSGCDQDHLIARFAWLELQRRAALKYPETEIPDPSLWIVSGASVTSWEHPS